MIGKDDTTFGWYHGTFTEPRTIKIEDIPTGTGLDTATQIEAKGLDAATAVWTE